MKTVLYTRESLKQYGVQPSHKFVAVLAENSDLVLGLGATLQDAVADAMKESDHNNLGHTEDDLWVAEIDEGDVVCECGHVTGEECCWSGPEEDTVVVEWMPMWLRQSHMAAGNSGVYPSNGAERLRLEKSCAQRLMEADPKWTREVD